MTSSMPRATTVRKGACGVTFLLLSSLCDAGTSSYKRPRPARILADDDYPTPTDCDAPPCSQQVHLALGANDEMVVVFASDDDQTPSEVTYWRADTAVRAANASATGDAKAYSQLMYYEQELLTPAIGEEGISASSLARLQTTTSWAVDPQTGAPGSSWTNRTTPEMGIGSYKNPAEYYNSPLIHTVRLRGLTPGAAYGYRVAGRREIFSFKMPPASDAERPGFPLTLGLTADLGQTAVSAANAHQLAQLLEAAREPHAGAVLLAGDLSYADGFYSRWDAYGRMMEPLAARVPVMTTGGNHEVGSGESWVSYNARYPMPAAASRSASNQWWSADVGPAHVIALCSYAATDATSLQYRWLARDLAAVDRAKTPWVIVMMHAPWYNSNSGHVAEAELMRRDMEPLLYAHGVDIVLSGHVHAYERCAPVYNFSATACGPHYLNLGDGGNREGTYIPWMDPQPEWSAFRESSFGVGALKLYNATHAYYEWTRSACESADAAEDHISFEEQCVSVSTYTGQSDNSEFPTRTSDSTWIVRRSRRKPDEEASCPPAMPPGKSLPQVPARAGGGGGGVGLEASTTVDAASVVGGLLAGVALGLLAPMCCRSGSKARKYVNGVKTPAELTVSSELGMVDQPI